MLVKIPTQSLFLIKDQTKTFCQQRMNGCSEEIVKKNKVVAGQKQSRLGTEIFEIGHQEPVLQASKVYVLEKTK